MTGNDNDDRVDDVRETTMSLHGKPRHRLPHRDWGIATTAAPVPRSGMGTSPLNASEDRTSRG